MTDIGQLVHGLRQPDCWADADRMTDAADVIEAMQAEITWRRAEIAALVAAYDDARSLGGDSEILRSMFRRLAAATPQRDNRAE